MSDTDTVEFLEETVRIPSHENVEEIRDYLVENVEGAREHGSGCLVAEKGEGSPHAVLNTHMDTVTPHVEYERDGDVIRGRGSCDAKASLAAMVSAFENVEPDEGSVTLVVSPDEETESRGLHDYVTTEEDIGEFGVVGEPTRLDVCTAAKGRFEVVVEFEGEAAHAASGTGTNAVSCAAEGVRRLESLEQLHDELLGESRLTVTRFEGGEAVNQVPERASIFVDRRSVPPETQDEFLEKVKKILDDIECETRARFNDRSTPFLEAFRTDREEEVVREMLEAALSVKEDAEVRPFDAATEASYLAREMPVVVFGPGAIDDGEPVAHSEREYVRVEEVEKAAEALRRFLESAV